MTQAPARVPQTFEAAAPGGVGDSPRRPDGVLKVRGEFAFGSDLWAEGMLHGATLRSPYPRARILALDTTAALLVPGVHAVLTHEDVPGRNAYGLEHADQPVLAATEVRYVGEPVAVVAADDPETARRALDAVRVVYEPLMPVTDARAAVGVPEWPVPDGVESATDPVHADRPGPTEGHVDAGTVGQGTGGQGTGGQGTGGQGTGEPDVPGPNVVRHVRIRRGDVDAAAAHADVVVTREYEVGMQDQAFLGTEAGLAVPAEDGGVDLFVATQWLHVDQSQLAPALGLAPELVRLHLAGVGGAFGAREDLSMQAHACMLALRTGRPVRIVYSREESFYGHVHRHPARLRYEHGARRDGTLTHVRAHILLDGGAYASSTTAVVANACTLGIGPYDVADVAVDGWGVYTNNPPCGAMRGFGAVQAAFAYESQMDALAAELGLDPVELRLRNAMSEGSVMPTGQVVDSPAPVADLLRRVRDLPLPPAPPTPGDQGIRDVRTLPGGVANTTHGEGVVRGVGYGVSIKNVGFSEGFDDYSTARVRLEAVDGRAVAAVHTAAAEVGQGLVTVLQQIVRTELGVAQVVVLPADTAVGSAGSTSASRQTYVTGGAVRAACEEVRAEAFSLLRDAVASGRVPAGGAAVLGELALREGRVVTADGAPVAALADVLGEAVVERTVEWRHRPTQPLDADGQGDVHVQWAFCAHRAVVDVDVELGLVKVVELAAAQDVGRAMHPQQVVGQIHGGTAQGLGLALMEEIQVRGGLVRNPSFTDYLIPTILDMPPMRVEVLELADPHAPYGLRGVGEPPTISSTPAVVAAVRAATGRPLTRVPIRPEHVTGT